MVVRSARRSAAAPAPLRRAAERTPRRAPRAARDSTRPWQVSPGDEARVASSAWWKPSSDLTPPISNSPSARSIRPIASLAVGVVDDQLRDHRVVERRDLRARRDARVDAHARARRLAVARDPPRRSAGSPCDGSSALMRHSIACPRSTTSSWRTDSGSPRAIRTCSRTRSTPVDELGDRVLDLDARVHLHEEVVAVRREQPLDRPRRAVAGRARRVDGDLPDPLAQLGRDRGRRRLLDELLVAALDRAVALAEMDHVAVRVGEHLHLDVPRDPRGTARRTPTRRRSTTALRAAPTRRPARPRRPSRRSSSPCRRRRRRP